MNKIKLFINQGAKVILECLLILVSFSCFAESEKPNVIIMLADDLGWNDVGYHNGDIDTPSLDQLAAEGMQLDRFYTTPICSPTRAALMTGRDPIRLGVVYAVILPWQTNGIHPDEHFMPESFKAAGYQTAMVGKWHLGHDQQAYHPNERGFDYFYGHLHTEVGFYPPFSNQGGKDFQVNGKSLNFKGKREDGYETFLLANEVTRYIKARDKDKPFFIYMPFIAPHTPLDAPQELQGKYKDINTDLESSRSKKIEATRQNAKLLGMKSARPMYAAVVDGMDQAIGQVLDTLEGEGLTENTIVLFFSDNGGAAYSYGGADNVPLRGGKGDTYEGGIRVVSLIRWPEKIPAGKKMDQIMTVMDVFPTIVEAAGVKALNKRDFDGKSLWSSIHKGKKVARKDYVFFASETPIYGQFNTTAFNEEWKLVQEIEQNQLETKIVQQLFKISEDPYEYNDLSEEYPKVVEKLAEKIRYWRSLYPISGTRSELVPPPGWRAPLDWATYPRKLETLQPEAAKGMAPNKTSLRMLDQWHGERGRLVYDCDPKWWLGDLCIKN